MTTIPELLAQYKTVSDLDQLKVSDARGNEVVRIGFVITLFFKEGHTKEKRSAYLRFLKDYYETFKSNISHYQKVDANRLTKIGDESFLDYYQVQAESLTEYDDFDTALYGFPKGVEHWSPTPYRLVASCSPLEDWRQAQLSNVDIYLPIGPFAADDYQTLTALFRRWCEILTPSHGTCGLGTIFKNNGDSREALFSFPLIKRFPGLDFNSTNGWKIQAEELDVKGANTIRTTNWLTVIDNDFVQRLGGLDALQKELDPTCPIRSYDGGIIIQAGPKPEVGDVNKNLIPAHYRTVARALKPVRLEEFKLPTTWFRVPDPLDPLTEELKWVRRFD